MDQDYRALLAVASLTASNSVEVVYYTLSS